MNESFVLTQALRRLQAIAKRNAAAIYLPTTELQ